MPQLSRQVSRTDVFRNWELVNCDHKHITGRLRSTLTGSETLRLIACQNIAGRIEIRQGNEFECYAQAGSVSILCNDIKQVEYLVVHEAWHAFVYKIGAAPDPKKQKLKQFLRLKISEEALAICRSLSHGTELLLAGKDFGWKQPMQLEFSAIYLRSLFWAKSRKKADCRSFAESRGLSYVKKNLRIIQKHSNANYHDYYKQQWIKANLASIIHDPLATKSRE